ncbi:hypothetical protein FB45DRAFT_892928 [Roridomyces roridus]|uniref:BRCT domain-containing protein n=1 Tax=Roridomyces roridus TaxID=1738132 RepID=A0AAD7CFH7_9AGAR|nr:hypothetical protein FB45DRAFT_892928 [Roridomyces roridus]
MVDIFGLAKCYLPETLSEARRAEITHILECNAGQVVDTLESATHIVTNSFRFEGWDRVKEDVKIISDIWADRSLILGTALPTEFFSADPAAIFSGVVACGTGISAADLAIIETGITSLGGQWRRGLTKDVTHLFATSPDSDKYATVMASPERTQIKVLIPHWFDDALRLGFGARLPTALYEWPNPKYLHPKPLDSQSKKADKLSEFQRVFFKSANWDPELGGPFPAPAEPVEQIWGRRKILLSPTLGLASDKRSAIEAAVEAGGGVIVPYMSNNGDGDEEEELDNVSECDVFVTRWRSGPAFFKAAREGKVVGTLAWIFYVHTTGIMTSPMDQLLHYPVRKKEIENFSKHRITVTNYTGEAREYIKRLISLMGAQYTPTMSNVNTILIAANSSGIKTEKAFSWSIPIVNQTWLEDCFQQWRCLTPAVSKYMEFPSTFDFAQMLAQQRVTLTIDDLDIEEEEDFNARHKAPIGTEASLREVEGLLESSDIVMDDEDKGEACLTPLQKSKRSRLVSEPRIVAESVSPQKQRSKDEDSMDVDEPGPSKRPQKPATSADGPPTRKKQPRRSDESSEEQPPKSTKEHAKTQVEANGKGKAKTKTGSTVMFAAEPETEPVPGPSSARVVKKPPPVSSNSSKRKAQPVESVSNEDDATDSDSPPPKKRAKPAAPPLKRKMTAGPGRDSAVPRMDSVRVLADEQKGPARKAVQKPAAAVVPTKPQRAKKTKEPESEESEAEPVEKPRRRSQGGRKKDTDTSNEIPPPKPSKSKSKAKSANASTSSRGSTTSNIKIMTTQVQLPDNVSKGLLKLGAKMAKDMSECTHLIAPSLVRTEKFLCALAQGAFIVSDKWATDCVGSSKLLPEEDYPITDPENEQKWDFSLADAMARAKENRGKLFEDMTFYVTSKVSTDRKLLKTVIAAQGGKMESRTPTSRILNTGSGRYVISCPEDQSIWKPLTKDHVVFSTELLLCAALTQELDFDNPAFRVPGSG